LTKKRAAAYNHAGPHETEQMDVDRETVLTGERLESLADLARDLREGHLHPSHYLELLFHRFARLEPRIQAFVEEPDRFERLEREAGGLPSAFPRAKARPLLYGVPVGVKDIIHAEGFPTRAGSFLPPHLLAGPEAECVRILKAAGALVLGKTVTAEFAYLAPGPTRNPHDLRRTPGGSSSGSAAAVACGLCPLALGTQTVGSIIRPASFCGILGFKPSFGRTPLEGVIPVSVSSDHLGFFCRDLEGIRLTAAVLCRDWQHIAPSPVPVIGVPEGPYLRRAGQESLLLFRKTLDRLALAGMELRPLQVMANFEEVAMRHNRLVAAEAAEVHSQWFAQHGERYRPETRSLLERGTGISPREIQTYRESGIRLRESLSEIMDREDISVWVSPSTVGPAPMGLHATGESIMNLPWTHAGLPALNLPSGASSDGMPMGLQVVGRWMEDEALLAAAEHVGRAL
jgi:Asp-tRNA(Asn)/Glu-tRNA(Gln) amidotransferase A subunit family amidase